MVLPKSSRLFLRSRSYSDRIRRASNASPPGVPANLKSAVKKVRPIKTGGFVIPQHSKKEMHTPLLRYHPKRVYMPLFIVAYRPPLCYLILPSNLPIPSARPEYMPIRLFIFTQSLLSLNLNTSDLSFCSIQMSMNQYTFM